jgi:hypothetical protein
LNTIDTRGSTLDRSRMLVAFPKPRTRKEVETIAREFELKLEEMPRDKADNRSAEINHTDRR